mgnify:CR=1 FL=1
MFLRKVFKVIFFSKWIFQKPEKKRILIFDRENSKLACKILNLSNYAVLDARYESINLYVGFITLLNTGYKNYVENYILNYVKLTNPRIVISFIDNNPFKQGLLAPGSSIPIVNFEQGMDMNPDLIFILAWNFRDEIVKQCRNNGFKGEFLVPFPFRPYIYNAE